MRSSVNDLTQQLNKQVKKKEMVGKSFQQQNSHIRDIKKDIAQILANQIELQFEDDNQEAEVNQEGTECNEAEEQQEICSGEVRPIKQESYSLQDENVLTKLQKVNEKASNAQNFSSHEEEEKVSQEDWVQQQRNSTRLVNSEIYVSGIDASEQIAILEKEEVDNVVSFKDSHDEFDGSQDLLPIEKQKKKKRRKNTKLPKKGKQGNPFCAINEMNPSQAQVEEEEGSERHEQASSIQQEANSPQDQQDQLEDRKMYFDINFMLYYREKEQYCGFKFWRSHCSKEIKLSPNQLTATKQWGGESTVFLKPGILLGEIYRIALKLENTNKLVIGMSKKMDHFEKTFVYQGWCYCAGEQKLYRRGKMIGTYGVQQRVGGILTMIVDTSKATISFQIDGVDYGVAHQSSAFTKNDIFVALCLQDTAKVSIVA